MKEPSGSKIEYVPVGPSTMLVYAKRMDCTILGNGFLVPCGEYSVGSFQVLDASGTLSTGVLKAMVANNPDGVTVAHPSAVSLSAAGASAGFPLEHAYVGVEVTTAQASSFCDIYLVLRL